MRGRFEQSILELHNQMLLNNPVGRKTYCILILIQSMQMMLVGLCLCINPNPRTLYPFGIRIVLFSIMAMQCTILIFYCIKLLLIWISIQTASNKAPVILSRESRMTYQALMSMILINQTVLCLPNRVFSLKNIIEAAIGGGSTLHLAVSIQILILDFGIALAFNTSLQTVYPLQSVPWSMPTQREVLITELTFYLFSIALAIPFTYSWLPYIYGVGALLTALGNIYSSTYYDNIVNKFIAFNQSCLLANLAHISGAYFGVVQYVQMQYAINTVVFCVSFFIIKERIFISKQTQLLTQTQKLSNNLDGCLWVQAVHNNFTLKDDLKPDVLESYFTQMQAILSKHRVTCDYASCACRKVKTAPLEIITFNKEDLLALNKLIKLTLIEIGLIKIIKKSAKEAERSTQKNNLLTVLLTFYRYFLDKNYIKCLFGLLKNHDCQKCTFNECFQYQILKKMLCNAVDNILQKDSSLTKYEAFVSYESNLKSYIKVIQKTTDYSQQFWQLVQKKELDVHTSDLIGGKLINKYVQFNKVYQDIKESCGEILLVENMAYHMHQEVLNFEIEALQNQQVIKQLQYHKRSSFGVESEEDHDVGNFQNSLVLIGLNSHNFQQILQVSKQFLKISGYHEQQLLRAKLLVIMPSIIDESHEKFLIEFIKDKTNLSKRINMKQIWLKKLDGIIKPINIQVVPRIRFNEGIELIGMVHEMTRFSIFDLEIHSNSVFCFLVDINFRIVHISESCSTNLKLIPQLATSDISIFTIIPDLPDDISTLPYYDCSLDLGKLENFVPPQFFVDHLLDIRIMCIEHNYGFSQILKEFLFVVLNQRSKAQGPMKRETISDTVVNFGGIGQTVTILTAVQEELKEESEDLTDPVYQMSSISSMSNSNSTNETNQLAQVSDIKNVINFSVVPPTLQRFRILLSVFLIVISLTSIALLVLNIQNNISQRSDLDAIQVENLMRSQFSSSKLAVVLAYGLANTPSFVNMSVIQTDVPQDDYTAYFQNEVHNRIVQLQSALDQFTQKQQNWDQFLVTLVTKDKIQLNTLTSYGNSYNTNQTFLNAMHMFINACNSLSNTMSSVFKSSADIFSINTVEQFSASVKSLPYDQSTLEQNFYFVCQNGGTSMLDQMAKIVSYFMDLVNSHGQSLIQSVFIFSMVCCAIVAVLTNLLLPFFITMENNHVATIRLATMLESILVAAKLKAHSEFKIFLEKNLFLNSSKQEDTSSLLQKIQTSAASAIPCNIQAKPLTKQLSSNRKQSVVSKSGRSNQGKTELEHTKQKKASYTPKKSRELPKEEEKQSEEGSESDEENAKDRKVGKGDGLQYEHSFEQEENATAQNIVSQSMKKKLNSVTVMYLGGIIIIVFYVACYLLSKSIMQKFQDGFYQYGVFYTKVPCLTETIFYVQKSILFNESLQAGTTNGDRFNAVLAGCFDNENNYRNIKTNPSSLFQGVIGDLNMIDNNLCTYMDKNQILNMSSCTIEANGFFSLGMQQIITSMLSQVQITQIKYNAGVGHQMNSTFNQQLFFDIGLLDQTMLYFKYLQKVLISIQNQVHQNFQDQMATTFQQLVILFGAFLLLLLLTQLVFHTWVIKKLKYKLLRTRMLLKLIPSYEIIAMKEKFEHLNVKKV